MMIKSLPPDTTLYPVPVVLVTSAFDGVENVLAINRIASVNAEPPMLAISIRPGRASHALIERSGEFVVSLPWPEMEVVTDYVGTTTLKRVDKWQASGLRKQTGNLVKAPLLLDCPVNIECKVFNILRLPSHSLFVAEVLAIHADDTVIGKRGEVDWDLIRGGLAYRAAVVRERPVADIRPHELLERLIALRSRNITGD
ncbi:MAG: flavin reductase family protein [Chloroflexi bacterium]|nr:flavin reductase family protein [Chloroflexota bacterium]